MKVIRTRGFTLIELLTVVAIIAILASMTMVVGPRMIMKAKITKVQGTMNQISADLADYYTKNNTYPPGYGFINFDNRSWNPAALPDVPGDRFFQDYYELDSWMGLVDIRGIEDYMDEFSLSGDTDQDNIISPLEFIPENDVLLRQGPDDTTTLWNGIPASPAHMMNLEKRSFVYIPVNLMQFKKLKRYWDAVPDGTNPGSAVVDQSYADFWSPVAIPAAPPNPAFPRIAIPAASYDAYVLLSVGPGGSMCGILPPPTGTETSLGEMYQVTALRAAYLATRDQDGDGYPDFNFENRIQGDSKGHYFPPWTELRGGQGPIIKAVGF